MSHFSRQIPVVPLIAGCSLLFSMGALQARVTHITISKTSPALQGQTFGKTGAYEIVKGIASGEIDPADRRNAVITDIRFAPRNANGKVPYTTTFSILKPVDMTKANGILVYDVVNRGNVRLPRGSQSSSWQTRPRIPTPPSQETDRCTAPATSF